MRLLELEQRVYAGENLLLEVLEHLLDKRQSNDLLFAISARVPIMIYEAKGEKRGDGLLYRALKNVGVPCVRSYQIDKEIGMFTGNRAFYTVYLVNKLDE